MRKQVIYGYADKRHSNMKSLLKIDGSGLKANVYKSVGKPYMWSKSGWPPIKVKVTVEEVKGTKA